MSKYEEKRDKFKDAVQRLVEAIADLFYKTQHKEKMPLAVEY